MDDLKYGIRNKRGDWAPNEPAARKPSDSDRYDESCARGGELSVSVRDQAYATRGVR